MKRWLFIFCLKGLALFSLTLQEKFEAGVEGSYIVTEQNEVVTLLHLHSKNKERLLFEEVSLPLHLSKSIEWKTYLQNGAPGATSWILYEIDLANKRATECYSLTRKAWLSTDEMNSFFIPLLSLDLKFLSIDERMQKGASSRPGSIGSDPWGPPQIKEGKKVSGPSYDVYTAQWPRDATELSGKQLVLYFDQAEETFPFPYWLQARDGALKFKVRAIDSGQGMVSPNKDIPRRPPTFSSALHKENGKLYLTLNAPTYYDSLSLYAVDLSTNPKITHSLSFEAKRHEEQLTLLVDEEKLDHLFTKGHNYLWIVADENQNATVEAPFIYTY